MLAWIFALKSHSRASLLYALRIGAVALLPSCGGVQQPLSWGAVPQAQIASVGNRTHRMIAAAYRVLYSFKGQSDGERPAAGLIDVDGTLYGTTTEGGSAGQGTVYTVTSAGTERVLHSFGHGSDGAGPSSGLIDVSGTLYGTTANGGSFGRGTVYSISTTGVERVLYSFRLGADGTNPSASLIDVNGALYGVTAFGGSGCGSTGCGTVYQMSTAGSERVIYRFKGGSGGADLPEAKLLNVNGTLYGTTNMGGSLRCYYHNGCGTVFSVTTAGVEKWLYSFTGGTDGSYPDAGLIDVNGKLYGTTSTGGGAGHFGTLYSISTDGAEKVVHRFYTRHSGAYEPEAGLLAVSATLYGTTLVGGSHHAGTIYDMSPTGKVTVLHNFSGGSDGLYPQSPLIDVHGTLYGTTYYDGGGGKGTCCGTVFALTL
jgi:uncharacterized repeat protein (TIGR03803 family)